MPHLLHPFYPQHLLSCWEQSGCIPPFTDPAPSHSLPCGTPSIHLPSWVSSSSVPAHWGDRWGPACSESGCLHSLSPKTTTSLFQYSRFSCVFSLSTRFLSMPPSRMKRSKLTSLLSYPPHSLAVWSADWGGWGGCRTGGGERREGREGGRRVHNGVAMAAAATSVYLETVEPS